MGLSNILPLVLILEAVLCTFGLKCFFCKYEYVNGVVYEEDHITKPIPYCGKDPYVKASSHIVDCDIYYDSRMRINPDFHTAAKMIFQSGNSSNVEPRQISGSDWWGAHLPGGTQRTHIRVKPYICMTVKTNESKYPGRSCGFNILLDCRQLEQITEGKIGPKSFLQECHQCTTDLCNVGVPQSHWNWFLIVCVWLYVIRIGLQYDI